jgi:MSHA biogenesis protein MshP
MSMKSGWALGTGLWQDQRIGLGAASGQRPEPRTQSPRARVRGFSLVAALFLVVVVAALGAFAVRIGASQQQTASLALLSARALAAANSGIEFGAYRALYASSCASATLNLTEGGLNGFTVSVTCNPTTHTEGGGTVSVYRIDATASAGVYGQPDYVSRQVYATFSSAP